MQQPSQYLCLLVAGTAAFFATPVYAGQDEATAAVGRAQAKIEVVSRHSSQPGMLDDQSFNQARQRLEEAKNAQKTHDYDTAQMLADEAALLAELTGERAKLASLVASRNLAVAPVSTPQ